MSSFSREDRYIVVKRSDLAKVVSHYQVHRFMETFLRVGQYLPKRKFLVVEADWPEYEPVWRMIESRVTGLPNELDTALSQLAALREELEPKTVKELLEHEHVKALSAKQINDVLSKLHEQNKDLQQRLADAERRNAELQKDHDAQQLLALVRLSDLRDMAVEGDKIYDLLRCCYPFVLARCKETDYGDASARSTLDMIDREFKRAALNKPEEAKP